MRSFAVCCILLALAVLSPSGGPGTASAGLRGLGSLILLGVIAHQVGARLGLPALTGWVLAGLLLGPSLLGVVDPQGVPFLALSTSAAGLWAGLLTGLAAAGLVQRRHRRLAGHVTVLTVAGFVLTAAAVALVTGLPLRLAVLFAALASLWGPLAWDRSRLPGDATATLVGTGGAALLLTAAVASDSPAGAIWSLRLWSWCAGGAVLAEVLWRLGLFERRGPALLGLAAISLAAAAAAAAFGGTVVPAGLSAGIVLATRTDGDQPLGPWLEPARQRVVPLFSGLVVAAVDITEFWPLPPWLPEIIGVQTAVLVLVRGVLPSLPFFARGVIWSPWALLPKGLIATELVLVAGAGLPLLLSQPQAHLLRAIVTADLLLAALVLAPAAARVPVPAPAETDVERSP